MGQDEGHPANRGFGPKKLTLFFSTRYLNARFIERNHRPTDRAGFPECLYDQPNHLFGLRIVVVFPLGLPFNPSYRQSRDDLASFGQGQSGVQTDLRSLAVFILGDHGRDLRNNGVVRIGRIYKAPIKIEKSFVEFCADTKPLEIENLSRKPRDVGGKYCAYSVGFDHFLHPLPPGAPFGRRTGFSQILIDNLDLRIRPTIRSSDFRQASLELRAAGVFADLFFGALTDINHRKSRTMIGRNPRVGLNRCVLAHADFSNVLSSDSSAAADILGRLISSILFSLAHLLLTLLAVQVRRTPNNW